MAAATLTTVEIRHFHLFAGLGGGAKGFNRGQARVGNLQARFRCLGGIDNDPAAMRDFQALAGVPGTVLDMFDREQYRAFHGREPAADWKEATPADIRRAAGNERPHIVFLSAPCKGFSGLLSETKSKTDKYQALNRLTLRGVWLMLEAWSDDPPEMVLFENVPRLATRGRALLDRITAMLRAYGYATAETTHDCGELGGLAQSRKRFLLVARHIAKVPPMLYEPQKRGLRAVGDVLGRMQLPGDPLAGPMHRVPALQWKTWVRLAFVEAGKDWRSLNRLAVHNGHLRDYLVVPEMFGGMLGVQRWDQPSTTITGQSRPSNGNFSIADPRGSHAAAQYQQYGVRRWDEAMGAVTGQSSAGGGSFSVADPRTDGVRHNNVFRVMAFGDTSPTVTGGSGPSAGGLAIADPRPVGDVFGKYAVTQWTEPSGTVISGSTTGQGAFAVSDPRPQRQGRLFTKYPVTDWNSPTGTVIGGDDCGAYAVADHRAIGHLAALHEAPTLASLLPAPADHLVALIVAADGTWHRPLTTLEMAALQSLLDPEEQLELDGLSDQAWRERIGNAVPVDAAQAIASEMGRTLLMAMSGETFQLSSVPIWVRQVAVGLAVAQPSAEVAP